MTTFAKPPLTEVVLGQVFIGRPDFLIPHFGVFWERLRERYPRCAHAPTIVTSEGPVIDGNGAMLPRVWLMSEDESQLIQVQQDRFYFNWRQTEKILTYPRFPAVKSGFDEVWNVFEEVVRELTDAPLVPVRLELGYINIIPAGDGWSTVEDLGRVLKDFRWNADSRYLPKPTQYQSQAEFVVPGIGAKGSVKASTAKRLSDLKEVLRLEIHVTGVPESSGQSRDDWISAAHDFIIAAFKDLTMDGMHTKDHWGLE